MDADFLPVMQAAYTGDLEGFRALIAADPTLVTRRSSCSHPTLLQFVAVDSGLGRIPRPVEAATILIEAGAPIDDCLLSAASTDARDVLRYLLDCGADLNAGAWKPLDEALYWSHTELAHELVSLGAAVDTLRSAAGLGDVTRMAEFFSQGQLGDTAGPIGSPFADSDDPELVNDPQHLLDNAMITAILNREVAAAAWLIERGANVNGKPIGFHWRGTALHAAVWANDASTVDWLLGLGADRLIRDDAYDADALGWAKHNGHDALAERLETE